METVTGCSDVFFNLNETKENNESEIIHVLILFDITAARCSRS